MVDTARVMGRKFLRGIERYLRSNTQWEVCVHPPHYLPTDQFNAHSWFQLQEATGLIALDSQHTTEILELNVPKIIHDTKSENPDVSTLYTNSERTGELAAQYFVSLGYNNFAFCGFEGLAWSQRRYKKFVDCLHHSGFKNIFNYHDWPGSVQRTESERWNIAEWLKTLPKPVCVFACNDDRGVYVLEACKIVELSVPEEVAVLGVDNDELICDLSTPSLSSIELNFERGGFQAAKLLDEMMLQAKSNTNIIVEPIDIVIRQSTNVFAVEDEQVVKALIFIRENYQEPIQVRDVISSTVLSRRDLELKFKNKLNRSIKEEINRLRIESVKRKLINTSDTIYNIANSLAYTDAQHFGRFFRQVTGISPSQYRRSNKPFG